jgi:muskelin
MCEDVPAIKALNFLQTDVSSVVDHGNREEEESFRALLSHLLAPSQILQPEPQATLSVTLEPPRKRSRPITPEDDPMDDSDTITDEQPTVVSIGSETLTQGIDPKEQTPSISADRFKQRNEVFENLLEYVSPDAKYPPGNLLDLVSLEMNSL